MFRYYSVFIVDNIASQCSMEYLFYLQPARACSPAEIYIVPTFSLQSTNMNVNLILQLTKDVKEDNAPCISAE